MTKIFKIRILSLMMILVIVFTLMPFSNVYAATTSANDGLAYASGTIVVHQYMYCNDSDIKGYIYANEGFTILVEESTAYYVQYSISSSPGYKQGYIKKNSSFNTCSTY